MNRSWLSGKRLQALATCAIIGAAWSRAAAYPTSCNVIPTADILEPGLARVEFENDGYPRIGTGESTYYLLIQVGLTPRLECGIDRWDVSGEPQDSLNAKFLVREESAPAPALAIGVMDLAQDSAASYYAVATKTVGALRLHGGYIHADYVKSTMLGCDYQLAEQTYLLLDWMRGPDSYLAFGAYQELSNGWALTLTYGVANQSDADDLMAINVAYTFPLWHPP